MSEEPFQDHYLALGITKDATAQQIKTTYRKLVLKCHPDKVTDPSLKAAASDTFHKIQTAWETLGDDVKKQKYDASLRLEELKRDFLKEREQSSSRRRSPSIPRPTRDARAAAYDAPPPATRGATYPPPFRAYERYETFRPRAEHVTSDDYYEDTSASKATPRKHSHYEPEPKKQSRSDTDKKKKHSSRESEKERSSRHDKGKRSEKDRRHDRKSKRVPIVEDETDSAPEYPARRYDSARETSKEHLRKSGSSDSEDSADEVCRKTERKKFDAATYMRRPTIEVNKGRAASLRAGWDAVRGGASRGSHQDQPRRSSARSPIRETHSREDRTRQYSDPTILRPEYRPETTFVRPPLEKHNTAPPDRLYSDRDRDHERDREYSREHDRERDRDRERRSKTMSSSKTPHDHPPLKRSETDINAHSRKPDLNRGPSGLRYEMNHGMPTPPFSPNFSPPRDPFAQSKSRRFKIEDDQAREVSPGSRPDHHTRSPSPVPLRESEHKSRTSSSRRSRPEAPQPPLIVHKHRTAYDPIYAEHTIESPRPTRPATNNVDYFGKHEKEPLYGEIPTSATSRRRQPREEPHLEQDYVTRNMSPVKERRSSRSTRPKGPHRSHTYSGSAFGIFA